MANEQFDRSYYPIVPDDLNDPPRFSQAIETTKDAVVLSLREFFDDNTQPTGRRQELPTIEKYAIGDDDPFLTTVEIVQEFPDILEKLPHVSITASAGNNRRMTLGVPLVAQVQDPPRVIGTAVEPFDFTTPQTLRYQVGYVDWPSEVVFAPARFATPAAATAAEVAQVMNNQALYAKARVQSNNSIGLLAGGREGGGRSITILDTSDALALTTLGFTAGQTDDWNNTTRPPANRYHQGSTVTINVDILTTDRNTRQELADLVYGWGTFWLERTNFELTGRSWTNEAVQGEYYHCIAHQEVSFGAKSEVNRPQDQKDKVHIQRVTIPFTTYYYLDRNVVAPDGSNYILEEDDVEFSEDVPSTS